MTDGLATTHLGTPPMPDTSSPQVKVLIVDDNQANRMLAQHTLLDEGYEVILAADGASGIAAFEQQSPGCVLLDIRMPDMDGIAVCEQIRRLPGGPDTPVLFLTAFRDIDTFDRAVLAGGDDFLTKPLNPTELVLRVKSALRLRRLTGELHDQCMLLKRQRDDMLRFQLHRERLTSFLVHDLKNPVNALNLHAQTLQRQANPGSGANSSVVGIRTAARKLTRMISDLLDLSKADEQQLTPHHSECDLRALVDEVLNDLGAEAQLRDVLLRTSVTATSIQADRDLVARMLVNLVENAIRHAPCESIVHIAASSVDGGAELRVTDAGPGIPSALREKVFSAFVHAPAQTKTRESAELAAASCSHGLGLTFCKFAAEVHGGSIWIEDARPGAVFCVRLPSGP